MFIHYNKKKMAGGCGKADIAGPERTWIIYLKE